MGVITSQHKQEQTVMLKRFVEEFTLVTLLSARTAHKDGWETLRTLLNDILRDTLPVKFKTHSKSSNHLYVTSLLKGNSYVNAASSI